MGFTFLGAATGTMMSLTKLLYHQSDKNFQLQVPQDQMNATGKSIRGVYELENLKSKTVMGKLNKLLGFSQAFSDHPPLIDQERGNL